MPRTLPPRRLRYVCLLLILAASRPARASVGVVDIHDLLGQDSQQHLSAESDGSQESSDHGPWTHTPQCTHSTSFRSLGTKYCVYTNRDAFINGISILSTPKTASSAIEFLDEEPLSYFFPPEQVEEWFSKPRPWKIVDIPGKDKGVVATRKIKRHETFMVDQANVIMDLEMEKSISHKENQRLLKVAVDQLRHPHLVRQLSSKHAGGGSEVIDEDIMMTNAFGTQLGDDHFRGLFPLVSRINHACDPNSFVMFSHSGFSLGIKAYRDIPPGEEISISYILLGKSYNNRQEGLKRWGFTCTCSLCSLAERERSISDSRRERIEAAKPELLSLWREGKHQAAIRVGEEIIKLMKEEGLKALLTDEYVILARLYLLRGDRELAEEYGDEALDILEDLGFLGTETKDDWDLERLLGSFADRGIYHA